MATTRPTSASGIPDDWQPRIDGLRELAVAAGIAFALMLPFAIFGGSAIHATWWKKESIRREAAAMEGAHQRLIASDALPMVDVQKAAHGRDLFLSACRACHGADGTGVPGLGKSLVVSDFVASRNDDQLAAFIAEGRPGAKPMPMPPRGGRTDLTDADLEDIVAYVRCLQDPRRKPELPDPVAPTVVVSADAKAKALEAAGGDEELAEYIAHGAELFNSTCIACHGKDGVGVKGNGKALANSAFIQELDDDALLEFIKKGRDPSDPKNTTGIGMPAKGGNPALSEDDILDIIEYLRTLQGDATRARAGG